MTVCAVIMKLLSVLVLLVALLSAAHGQGEMDSLFIIHIKSFVLSTTGRGTVRLYRNGFTSISYSAGIVQIYYFTSSSSSNRWGNICDDLSFASNEATVICRQLGYTGASTYGRAGSTSRYIPAAYF